MLMYPTINPVALQLGPLAIHWYGIMYLIGFTAVWLLARYRVKKYQLAWTSEQLSDIVFYGAMGAVLGGRLFYVFIYALPDFLAHPFILFHIWDGGMSFHGGLFGVIMAMWLYAKKIHRPFFSIMDFIAPFAPVGLGAGRLGNFINGELWGRVTTMPWGMVYPDAGPLPRHPSELYEFLLEGVLLLIILWCYSKKPRPPMAVSALFLMAYGCFRFIGECFREPDPQLGFIVGHSLTMGQLLSLPMILLGMVIWVVAHQRSLS